MLDPNASDDERYKMLSTFSGSSDVWLGTSEDGHAFGDFQPIFSRLSGDDNYSSFFYDEARDTYGIGARQRAAGSIPSDGPPEPYQDQRWAVLLEAETPTGTWTERTSWRMSDDAFWSYTDDANYEPDPDPCFDWHPTTENRIKPDIYFFPVARYRDIYIGIVPIFFREDARVPAQRPGRTTGELYPIFVYSTDGLSWSHIANRAGQDDNQESLISLTPYQRVDSHACHSGDGANEVGQLYPGAWGANDSDVLFPVIVRPSTHYESTLNTGGQSDLDDTQRRLVIYRVRRDAFASLGTTDVATWTTPTIELDSQAAFLEVNARIEGSIRAQVLDADGDPMPGLTFSEAIPRSDDARAILMEWDDAGLHQVAGQSVRLSFEIDDGQIFSFSLREAEQVDTD